MLHDPKRRSTLTKVLRVQALAITCASLIMYLAQSSNDICGKSVAVATMCEVDFVEGRECLGKGASLAHPLVLRSGSHLSCPVPCLEKLPNLADRTLLALRRG
jgi:hypothetical protein